MRFEFGPTKAATNLKKHGVSFADAEAVFEDALALHKTDPDAQGEERFVAIGLGSAGNVLVVVYTFRESSIRLISARRATRQEARAYAS